MEDKRRPQTASVAMQQPIVQAKNPFDMGQQQKQSGLLPKAQAKPAGFAQQPTRSAVVTPSKMVNVLSN